MWCIYTQPPKKALDYVQDHSSGVSNEVKKQLFSFSDFSVRSCYYDSKHLCFTIHYSIQAVFENLPLYHRGVSSIIPWTLIVPKALALSET